VKRRREWAGAMLAHLIASADGEGGDLEVGKLLRLADRKAARRGRPDLAFSQRFVIEVAGRELERQAGRELFDWDAPWEFRDEERDRERADLKADRERQAHERGQAEHAAKRERDEAARERVAADVLARLPNTGEVRVTPGRLATDALDRARELGRPGLALDRRFVAGVAKGYLAGQLGAAVLDD
jgi:hypothetical protein